MENGIAQSPKDFCCDSVHRRCRQCARNDSPYCFLQGRCVSIITQFSKSAGYFLIIALHKKHIQDSSVEKYMYTLWSNTYLNINSLCPHVLRTNPYNAGFIYGGEGAKGGIYHPWAELCSPPPRDFTGWHNTIHTWNTTILLHPLTPLPKWRPVVGRRHAICNIPTGLTVVDLTRIAVSKVGTLSAMMAMYLLHWAMMSSINRGKSHGRASSG